METSVNNKCRAFTSLEQSKVLSKILSDESADMVYIATANDDIGDTLYTAEYKSEIIMNEGDTDYINCWSLAALLEAIPQEIFDGEYILNITEGCDNRWALTYDHFENRNHSYFGLATGADNLVDACVAMIEKLNELNLL